MSKRVMGWAAVLCATAGLLAGCADAQPAVPSPAPLSEAAGKKLLDASADNSWKVLLKQYPNAQKPAVALVRTVSRQEWATAQAECMAEKGFPQVSAKPDGSIALGSLPNTQAQARAVALYECQVEYPLEPKYLADFNDSQLKYLYAYYTGDLAKCLEEHGVQVPEAPSEQTFLDKRGAWSPYEKVDVSESRYYELVKACPEIPTAVYG
ncbi:MULTISPECIES: hypothetical protein [unclassified Curtobacterium]|uniref:hypothetical protein n=1 Tax=unclassified Curtobacterium TaxID=257496 RepID=UPI000F98F738|nr:MULTISPECIES: hypothetical protein [unclassified Curtobacterium]ROQ18185.1 hypothetical protein EDF41_0148 [Curtobacterium sp. PhB171]ROQ29632.1 hypothetical protein EDF40_0101 [Curtobacterium sp. PhB170]ROS32357.1 hypothetical protein EDF25_3775 [Curtobacterium sp. PhB131]ROS73420.1 hypothetical protein EDF30_0202 [Curtobacterium sp. PhB141]TCL70841.1 hypothetical protein EDF23_1174 [Curtobacterium sp. PhB128]